MTGSLVGRVSDGAIGDDGRIYTSRNTPGSGLSEPLYGIANVSQEDIATPGDVQTATINVTGQLNKAVNLTPYNVEDPSQGFQDPLYVAVDADDIIFGGWGGDFLHGGSGNDAMSGAEALAEHYANPVNAGDALLYDPATETAWVLQRIRAAS